MRKRISLLPANLLLTGCGGGLQSYVHTDSTLGRVVVYKSGVAYFERTARLDSDHLVLKVPGDKVDDFLKSLKVVDAETGKPAPVSYPTRAGNVGSGLVDMTIGLGAPKARVLKLMYVTEAPSWKPSYRVVVGNDGKVDLQAWAIVDNTSGEDWTHVKLGVGSSSALSFRYDLGSVRVVQRETLQSTDLFAFAPPTGGPTYGNQQNQQRIVAVFKEDDVKAARERTGEGFAANTPAAATTGLGGAVGPRGGGGMAAVKPSASFNTSPPPADPRAGQLRAMAQAVQVSKNKVLVEGFAKAEDGDKDSAALDRANVLRNELIRHGADPNKLVAVSRGQQSGFDGGARLIEAIVPPPEPKDPKKEAAAEPIGTSHFESQVPMNVPKGTSAMVSILETKTDGEIVYLYDAEGPRGNATFPFKAVRLKNASDSTLESGPVSVFGEGKFIGEGIAEPVPPGATAFVPFALDRQIVVEQKRAERDEIARVIKVSRGVFSTETQHVRKSTLELHNRLSVPAVVYVKHLVPQGYKLTKSPDAKPKEKLDGAQLARVELKPSSTTEIVFEEQTPVLRSVDVRTAEGLGQVKLFLSQSAETALRDQVEALLKLNDDMAKIDEQLETMRQQQSEYKARIDELHVQLVTLKAVKSAGLLMANLEKKMSELSDKLTKSTLDLVALQEKRMIARVHFEDGVAELSLDKKDQPKTAAK